jgi:hypothetical protein
MTPALFFMVGSREYKTAEELQTEIDAYFELIAAGRDNPTITGLAYYLGFASRQSFYDYEQREKFTYIVKRARLKIESVYEGRLFYKNPTGAIFGLKNMGWTDRQEIQHQGFPDPMITIHIEKPKDE